MNENLSRNPQNKPRWSPSCWVPAGSQATQAALSLYADLSSRAERRPNKIPFNLCWALYVTKLEIGNSHIEKSYHQGCRCVVDRGRRFRSAVVKTHAQACQQDKIEGDEASSYSEGIRGM